MKLGKNVFTETRYTDGYFKINIQKHNNTVLGATITTPDDDMIAVKSVNKLKDLSELLQGLISDWEEVCTVVK